MPTDLPQDLRYTQDHEWIRRSDDGALAIGITEHAAEQLGDVTAVEVDGDPGDQLTKGDVFGSVDSVKAVSDLFAPLSGELVAINEALEDEPELVNADPYGRGWMITIKPSDPADFEQLLDAATYAKLVADE
jgi:glycine cleavage system H protein